MTEPPPQPPEPALATTPGALVDARLPGMAGKIRPGLVIHAFASDAGDFRVVLPLTTRRTNQPGSWLLTHPSIRPSFVLAPVAAIVPTRLILSVRGAVGSTDLDRALAETARWYGADWRESHPQIRAPRDAAKTMNGATLKR